MCRYGFVILLLGLGAGSSAAQDAQSKADLEKLQGKWQAVSAIHGGKPDRQLEKWTLVQNKLIVHWDSERTWTITLDASKQPKQMDLVATDSTKTMKAIYELDGDTLRFCIEMKDKDRPVRFGAKLGSGNRLVVFKRVVDSEDAKLLHKERELLQKERDSLRHENETLKQENATLKKGKGIKPEEEPKDAVMSATADKVEYAYQGSVRNGNMVIVTVLATSKEGNRAEVRGQMTLIDEEGNKFVGHRVRDTSPVQDLRESVPVKLHWEFGGSNSLGAAAPPAPAAKVKRFAAVIIDHNYIGRGPQTIEFRNVPFTVTKPK